MPTRLIPVTRAQAEACEGFVDAMLMLPLALDKACSRVRYDVKYGELRAPLDVVQSLRERAGVLRQTMESVEAYCLEKGCTVVTPDCTHVRASVLRRFIRHAVPALLGCLPHWCAQYTMLMACAKACRARATVCSVSGGPETWYRQKVQLEYLRRIQHSLRGARRLAALVVRIANATVDALGTHELAESARSVAEVLRVVAHALASGMK
jgi:hypothetical protein